MTIQCTENVGSKLRSIIAKLDQVIWSLNILQPLSQKHEIYSAQTLKSIFKPSDSSPKPAVIVTSL